MIAPLLARAASTDTIRIDDEALVLDESDGGLHVLNATAAIVWECLDGVSTLDDICVDLAEAFGVPYDRVAADVTGITERMLEDRLVTPVRSETDDPDLAEPAVDVADRAVDGRVETPQP